jgi:hypothetical protein
MRSLTFLLISALFCVSTLAPGCVPVERSGAKPSKRYTLPYSDLTDTLTAVQQHAVEVAKQTFPELNSISKRTPMEIGYSGDIFVQNAPDGWKVIFYSGWDDCPAGCINGRWYYVSVDTTGVARMSGKFKREYDGSANRYLDSGVALWGMPK